MDRKKAVVFFSSAWFFAGTLAIGLLNGGCARPGVVLADKGGPIVCLGDSLTSGEGALPGQDYPSVLGKLIGRTVINAGVSGDTTREALARLEKDVISANPALVIVALGANDFFQGIPKKETMDNLRRIVERIQQTGAGVVLVETRVHVVDPYLKLFQSLAREKRLLLIPDILKGIFSNPALKSDQLHPNAAGYALMAERIA
ncbi:MAG TPA: GDSL-type esterase/lipase family protein, partial [bacterium]|nr:GDSL-type esterase/lipase family protein [bacterium]